MCGYGRHALSLARLGINVTAVDNLADYIREIREVVETEDLPVTALNEDVIQFQTNDKYDLIICMGNSVSFFNRRIRKNCFRDFKESEQKWKIYF
jgi:cyclopropane fatty-acyl-phospholipid synthase-like methyltransferase